MQHEKRVEGEVVENGRLQCNRCKVHYSMGQARSFVKHLEEHLVSDSQQSWVSPCLRSRSSLNFCRVRSVPFPLPLSSFLLPSLWHEIISEIINEMR